MRFRKGMPPSLECRLLGTEKLTIDYSEIHVAALVLGVVLIGPLLYVSWRAMYDNSMIFAFFDHGPFVFLGILVLILVVHESIHLFAHPRFGLSNMSFVGYVPKGFLVYASYQGEQTRVRLLVTLAAPFVVMTVIPLLVCFIFDVNSPSLLPHVSIINGVASCGDILLSAILLTKIPRGRMIQGDCYGFLPSESSE